MTRFAVVIPVALVVLAACCAPKDEPGLNRPDRRTLYLLPVRPDTMVPDGTGHHAIARVEVSANDFARQRGLMHRESLRADHGMLFIYPRETNLGFWMKNTIIPLSIAYADATGRVVSIRDMAPGVGIKDDDLPHYPSGRPALYALEMEQGWFAAKGIRVGDRIVLHPEIAASEVR